MFVRCVTLFDVVIFERSSAMFDKDNNSNNSNHLYINYDLCILTSLVYYY